MREWDRCLWPLVECNLVPSVRFAFAVEEKSLQCERGRELFSSNNIIVKDSPGRIAVLFLILGYSLIHALLQLPPHRYSHFGLDFRDAFLILYSPCGALHDDPQTLTVDESNSHYSRPFSSRRKMAAGWLCCYLSPVHITCLHWKLSK